jgi:dTDP-4-amino-4,6-dideoxygalactose transaminase
MIEKPAILGGTKSVTLPQEDLFTWPIITDEDESAVLDVLRRGAMSGTEVTRKFESEFAVWQGCKYALGCCNGTAAILEALYGCGIGTGDEVLCTSVVYWAAALPVRILGARPVFVEIDPQTLCMDPADIEHRITKRTRALIVVHNYAYPADLDPIMEIASKYNLKLLEDVSHAQGGLYKGRKLGTFGDAAAMSLMSEKSLAIGEGGMLVTDDIEIYERAIAYGHYERFTAANISSPELLCYAGLPLGGAKHRMNQLSSSMGIVQLRRYDERCIEIRKAMNYFWDQLEGVPGIRAHRVDEAATGSTMAGWYAAHGLYRPEELGGLSITRFAEAVRGEGAPCYPGANLPLHQHRLLGPQPPLPVSEGIGRRTFTCPWFKKFHPNKILEYARAYRKAAQNADLLLAGDSGDPESLGSFSSQARASRL